ncbi:helix-turn-helix domain-containing protein [candidate division KSB1 bacterium]|nr:helix-turn-helix domain-containing protein [candidate division KSB1 bacterium]
MNYTISRTDEIEVVTFGDLIRKKRTEKGLYQKELAEILGVNEMTVVNWEKGRTVPINENLKRIVNYFGLRIEDVKGLV